MGFLWKYDKFHSGKYKSTVGKNSGRGEQEHWRTELNLFLYLLFGYIFFLTHPLHIRFLYFTFKTLLFVNFFNLLLLVFSLLQVIIISWLNWCLSYCYKKVKIQQREGNLMCYLLNLVYNIYTSMAFVDTRIANEALKIKSI